MKIIGFSINKISAERKAPIKGKLEVKSGLNIEDITSEEISISQNPSLKFDFNYEVNYNPDIASILIKGSVIVIDDKNESKEILKNWKKKQFEHPIKLHLFNSIMDKCNLKALVLEEEFGLPFHIPLPKLAQKPKEEPKSEEKNKANYTG